jgi:hypothetical protein
MPDHASFDAEHFGLCPCGGEIWVGRRVPAVIHSLPYCKKFKDLEPDKFLRYVRKSRGIPDPEAPPN